MLVLSGNTAASFLNFVSAGFFDEGLTSANFNYGANAVSSTSAWANNNRHRWRAHSASWAGATRNWKNRGGNEVPMTVKSQALAFTASATVSSTESASAPGVMNSIGQATIADNPVVSSPGVMKYVGAATVSDTPLVAASGKASFKTTATIADIPVVSAAGKVSFHTSAIVADTPLVSASGKLSFGVSATVADTPLLSALGLVDFAGSANVSDAPKTFASSSLAFNLSSTVAAQPDASAVYSGFNPSRVSKIRFAYDSINTYFSLPALQDVSLDFGAFQANAFQPTAFQELTLVSASYLFASNAVNTSFSATAKTRFYYSWQQSMFQASVQ